MKKHVLVIADIDSDDTLSLEKARDIILPFNATVEIVKFIDYTDETDISATQRVKEAKSALDDVIDRVFEGKTEVVSEVIISNSITDWVLERCERSTVDLVVKSRHRTESIFHTPTDWQLVRQLSCPILIATHLKWKPQANILLALDLSTEESEHQQLNALILSWGKLWSRVNHFKLHSVYSIPIARPLLEFDLVDRDTVQREQKPLAQEKMDALLNQYGMNDVTTHITAGPSDKLIPHWAGELHCDLVIMGSIGRAGVSGFLLGNTAEKALHNLYSDCLIVKLAQD